MLAVLIVVIIILIKRVIVAGRYRLQIFAVSSTRCVKLGMSLHLSDNLLSHLFQIDSNTHRPSVYSKKYVILHVERTDMTDVLEKCKVTYTSFWMITFSPLSLSKRTDVGVPSVQ